MMFLITYGHLRHSHMWIPFTGVAGRILQSPAHHQLHHSVNPAHYGKNLGFALAVWDWAFGTLAIPSKTREPIVFGVRDEAPPFRSALGALVTPCARLAGHVAKLVAGSASAARQPKSPRPGASATALTWAWTLIPSARPSSSHDFRVTRDRRRAPAPSAPSASRTTISLESTGFIETMRAGRTLRMELKPGFSRARLTSPAMTRTRRRSPIAACGRRHAERAAAHA